MRVTRRAEVALGGVSALLLGGVIGVAWWGWRCRTGHPRPGHPRPGHGAPAARLRRVRAALVALGLLLVATGTAWRLVVAAWPVPECVSPGPLPASPLSARLVAEKLATWPETGLGILYSQATGARVCLSRVANYYVAVNEHHIVGARAMTIGDVVLKPDINLPPASMRKLVAHEAGHRTQWAVATAAGGPLAFPVAYGVAEFFFPGERNPFERMAGLENGGYTSSGAAPVLGPAQLAALGAAGALAALIAAAALARRRR